MADQQDYRALNWVRDEIEETLSDARWALVTHLENSLDVEALETCKTLLHQVTGSLEMVGFQGAVMLARETEAVAIALLERTSSDDQEAQDILMRAILQLPHFLDRAIGFRRDVDLVELLPLLNDMRAVSGQPLLSEGQLFNLDVSDLQNTESVFSPSRPVSEINQILRKAHQLHQIALLGLLRGDSPSRQLARIAKLWARLEAIGSPSGIETLLGVAAAYTESLSSGSGRISVSAKQLLGQLDRVARRLAKEGVTAFSQPVDGELLKNLLYYVAISASDSARMIAIRKRFRLDQVLSRTIDESVSEQSLTAPDKAAINAVVQALSDELTQIKEALERYLHGGKSNAQELQDVGSRLNKASATLVVMGLNHPKSIIDQQLGVLEPAIKQDIALSTSELMDMADALLKVEYALTATISGKNLEKGNAFGPLDMAKLAVLHECRLSLTAVQEKVNTFVKDGWQKLAISEIPALLDKIKGGLDVIEQPQLAAISHGIERFVRQQLQTDASTETPDEQQLNLFAEVLVGIDYALDALTVNEQALAEKATEQAQACLQQLGYTATAEIAGTETADTQEPTQQNATTEPADDDLIDDEIIAIFEEEAGEVLVTINEYLPRWAANTADQQALTEFRRAFHTLKGSGRMVGANVIGELAWSIESMLNRVIDHTIEPTVPLVALVQRAHQVVPSLVDAFVQRHPPKIDVQPLMVMADRLAAGEAVDLETLPQECGVDEPDKSGDTVDSVDAIDSDDADEPAAELVNQSEKVDDSLEGVFVSEARRHIGELKTWLNGLSSEQTYYPMDNVVTRVMHSIKGSAALLGLSEISTLAAPAEEYFSNKANAGESLDQSDIALIKETAEVLEQGVDDFQLVGSLPPELVAADSLIEAYQQRLANQNHSEQRYAEIFLSAGMDDIIDAGEILDDYQLATDNTSSLERLTDSNRELAEDAKAAKVDEITALAMLLADCYERVLQQPFAELNAFIGDAKAGQEELLNMIDGLAAGLSSDNIDALTQRLQQWLEPPSKSHEAASSEFKITDDIDPDILDIFMEEADEIDGELEPALTAWRQQPDNQRHANEVKRLLHTLKGGARLAGLYDVGESCHYAETLIEDAGRVPDRETFDRLLTLYDQLVAQMAEVKAAVGLSNEALNLPTRQPAATPTLPQPESSSEDDDALSQPAAQSSAHEMVRISADLLESLLNLSGESSINRGRVEQQVNDFSDALAEMEGTLERLREQLRRMGIETEAQMMSNYKQGVESGRIGSDFDPLEMDQYSELHQITRQMSESASDLTDLRNTLVDGTRDTETLLLQQARVNSEMQEKLMQTRMIPFARLVPRLRRMVRQVSADLDKQAELEVIGADVELDRSLVDRIIAPLEHILRNAVGHGIETPAQRLALGKPESGRITLELGRDGGEICLQLSDDGRGIDSATVFQKAVERQMISASSDLSDAEILPLVFAAGFSTAEQVTQVSGRGVGLDVVATDIKQIGGSVSLTSEPSKGTQFDIRLPFTLAMSRALLVRSGANTYAIPLVQVDAIVRIDAAKAKACLQQNDPFFYDDNSYYLDHIENYVQQGTEFDVDTISGSLPVLLLHAHGKYQGLVVDGLVGSREIVMKPLGPQLASVAGVSGATIMGDGSVVLILDMPGLIQRARLDFDAAATEPSQPLGVSPAAQKPRDRALIMVTDDSVTVRKFTTRMLERNGFDTMTAKDGVDAVAKLEERRPDLMLLDIEMPRMDGFEVATHMRNDKRFKQVPIVMITSRTGDKHRRRAFDMGVNQYLGKPYQEAELLESIRELLSFTGEQP